MGQGTSRTVPLIEASFSGDEQRIKQLLGAGSSPLESITLKRYGEVTPVLAAVHANHLGALCLLLVNITLEEINATSGSRRFTALHLAASKGHDEIVEALLSRGADLYAQDNEGNSALILAVQYRRLSTVWVLCARIRSTGPGEYVDLANHRGQTALHIACEIGDLAIVSCLLKKHADPNLPVKTRGRSGLTPIVAAVLAGNHEVVLALLTAGSRIDVDIENRRGLTLLHLAVLFNHAKIITLLMEHGHTPVDMPSPFLVAVAFGRVECFKELLTTSREEIDRCIEKGGRLDLVALVIEKLVGRVPETPEPPMAWAIQFPCRYVTRSISVLGFKGNMQFTSGIEHMTKEHFLCVELLLQVGAGITSDQLYKLQQQLMHAKIVGALDEDLQRFDTTINEEICQCSRCGLFGLWPNDANLRRFCSSKCSQSSMA